MKEFTLFSVMTFIFAYTAGQYGVWDQVKERADTVHNYEYKSLTLAKKLRVAARENQDLKAQIARLKSEKEHLEMNLLSKQKRTVASVAKKDINDLVNFEVYKWGADKLLGVGQQALHFKKYDKSAQFYNALIQEYPKHKIINDKVLFEAGIAAYESKKHYKWATQHFSTVIQKHPKSKFYRGAKLWLALSHFHTGEKDKFLSTVEEFRQKYRNTKEWKVLSRYYEDINYKYNK